MHAALTSESWAGYVWREKGKKKKNQKLMTLEGILDCRDPINRVQEA